MDKSVLFSGIFCFCLGMGASFLFQISGEPSSPIPVQEIFPEISLVRFLEIDGDELLADVSGPVRLVWAESMIEKEGVARIPLSQFPMKWDIDAVSFPYTGNTKTQKFYPSDTYWARGVAPKNRRLFLTKEEAVKSGFIPSKSVE